MLKDKVIAITGATGAIGSALAKGVIDNGGKLLLVMCQNLKECNFKKN